MSQYNTIKFKQFADQISQAENKPLRFYLPNGESIPAHFHITDVGSVTRNFIDCGAKIRTEQQVQIQIWLGKDTEHRLTSKTADKILKQSQQVLNLLENLDNNEVLIEYQTEVISQYPIAEITETPDFIEFYLQSLQTQCLAAIRHQQEIENQQLSRCCSKQSSTTNCSTNNKVVSCCG